jgi:hemolysin activation/secretion protein
MRTALTILYLSASIANAQLSEHAAPELKSVRLITADNRPLPGQSKLVTTLNSHLGKPTDEAELGQLADIVVEHLRQRHWPVSLVTVWDEDDGLSKGDVSLQVQQGKLGDIAIFGGSKRRQRAVAERLKDIANQPLNGLQIQRRLDSLAFSPWLACTSQAVPSHALDTANLVLTLHDEFPIHGFASYENNGVEPLGENRYTIGIEWLNAFALGQDLSLMAISADDPDTLLMFAANWRIPLPWRNELRFSGYYSETNSTAEVLTIPLNVNGITWEANARYIVPWRLGDHWRSEWSLGFDYKRFDTGFTFGSTAVLGDTTGVGTLVIGNQWFYDTAQNHARFAIEAAHGEPGWAKGQNEDEFEELVPGASPRFTILRADASFQHDFNNQMQTALRFGGQWADGPLLPSEELGLASVYAVRGYPERSIRASRGAWASLEVRSPPWQPFKSHFKLRALAFTDGGWSADDNAITETLASAGLGLRAELTQHLQLRCDLAFPLSESEDDFRVHLAAVLKF